MNSIVAFGNTYLTLTLSAVSLALLMVYLPPQGRQLLRITTIFWPTALVMIAVSGLLFAVTPLLWPPLLTLANMTAIGACALLALITASWNRRLDRRLLIGLALAFAVATVAFEVWRQAGAPTFKWRVYFASLARAGFTAWMVVELWRFNRERQSVQVGCILLFGVAFALANLARAAATALTGDTGAPNLYSEGLLPFYVRIVIIATQLFVALSFTNYFFEVLWRQERDASAQLERRLQDDLRAAQSRENSLSEQLDLSQTALSGLKTHFAIALEAAEMGMWVRDGRTGEVWVSDGWRRIYGLGTDERPDSSTMLSLVHPDDRNQVYAFVGTLTDGDRHAIEYRIVRADGAVRWIATWSQLEKSQQGDLRFARAISVDVTERKEAERELHQRRLEVTHLSRVNMLGELSGGIAHELNQPLSAILSNAQAGQRFVAQEPLDVAELRAIFDDIVTEDQRAGEIIRRLRRLFTAGEVQRQRVDLNALIGETVRMLQSDLISHHVHCITELAEGLPSLEVDPVQVQQVLINLLLNANEAMASTPAEGRRIWVTTRRVPRDGVGVEVADTGPGIAPGDAERVFQAFHSTKAKGLGLGLSVCRTIVQAHEGRIWAQSRPGGGALFTFTLPVV